MATSDSDGFRSVLSNADPASLFAAALGGLPEPVVACIPDGGIVYANRRAYERTGVVEDKFVSLDLPAYPKATDGAPSKALRESIGEAPARLKAILHTERGRSIPCTIKGSFIEQNGATLLLGILRNGTGQQSREERGEEFRYLVKGVTEYAIFVLDPEGHVATWNEGAERIKKYTPEEIIGAHFSTFYPPDAAEAGVPGRVLETARQEGPWTGEGWRMRKDGRRFWAHVTVTALHGEDESVRGFAKITRDTTGRHRRELELER